jgi:hypothetical protein
MKRIQLMFTGSALLAAALTGCGGGSDGGMAGGGYGSPGAPGGPSGVNLDTAGVLAIARQTSETDSPLSINDGAVMVTGSSEATSPAETNVP